MARRVVLVPQQAVHRANCSHKNEQNDNNDRELGLEKKTKVCAESNEGTYQYRI